MTDKTSVVLTADFINTLCKASGSKKTQGIEIVFNPLVREPAVPSIFKFSFETSAHNLSAWKGDGTNHWHECDTCGLKKDLAEHTFTDKHNTTHHWKECSVCGQKIDEVEHAFDWVVDQEATEEAVGSKHQHCTVCGYDGPAVEIPKLEHTHIFGAAWKKDDTNHWHECACGAKSDQANHTFVLKHYKNIHWEECSVCGQKRNEENHTYKPNHDKTYHWEECTCGAIRNRRFHTFEPKHDETYHWDECACGEKKNVAAHDFEWVVDREATEAEAGSKHQHCTVCGYDAPAVEIPVVKPEFKEYLVTKGAEQIYNVASKDGALFKVNGDLELFQAVYVDDTLVDPSNYSASKGSTIVQFTKDYMNTLALGQHSLKVEYVDGAANTTFTIVKDEEIVKPENDKPENDKPEDTKPSKPGNDSPQTGDTSNVTGYVAIFVVALALVAVVVIARKKKNK